MTLPQLPLAPHLGEPAPTRQQELSHLLAALLTQYLTAHKAAHKHQATSQTTTGGNNT
ncbi:MAG: hypothetical protein HS099_03485 [Ardenticatenaceae bacterium]|nr:hypothetical protein [Ardenticatenaceae bacterium]